MPQTQIEVFEDSPAARMELEAYLSGAIDETLPSGGWSARFGHWWDENPFAELHPARGWTLRQEGRLAGFLALIPMAYSVNGVQTPALAASTWVVDPACRNASLPMFMKLRQLGREVMIADTTPSPEVQALMDRAGWRAEKTVVRRYFSTLPGMAGGWPTLPHGLRVITDLGEVSALPRPFQRDDRIEKWITLDSLRWQLHSPMHRHRFLGLIDEKGTLTSFLVLADKPLRRIPAWFVMEAWTARETKSELHAMTGAWLGRRAKTDLPWRPFFSANEFEKDDSWTRAPALHSRRLAVCHYFQMPEALSAHPKHTVMAEGDLAL